MLPGQLCRFAGRVCTGDVSEGLSLSPPGRLLGNTALAGEGLQKPDPGWTGGLRAQPEGGSGTNPALRAGREPVPPRASLSLCVSPEGAQCLCGDLQWPGTGAVPEQELLGLMGDCCPAAAAPSSPLPVSEQARIPLSPGSPASAELFCCCRDNKGMSQAGTSCLWKSLH